jgi:hypothetical protein
LNILKSILTNRKMWSWLVEEGLKTTVVTAATIAVAAGTNSLIKRLEDKKKEAERGPMGFMRYR